MATKTATTMTVSELEGRQRIDRESGSLVVYRRFQAQRPGHEAHVVEIEVSHSGMAQSERCDCAGYQYRHDCAHITAVCESDLMSGELDI